MIGARATLCMLLFAAANAQAISCAVSVPMLDFGSYDVFSTTKNKTNTTVALSCSRVEGESASVPYTMALSTGLSNSYVQRTLVSGGNILLYNLYQQAADTQILGDGTGGSLLLSGTLTFSGNSLTKSANVVIHGAIPTLQDAAVGTYTDQITVTLNY